MASVPKTVIINNEFSMTSIIIDKVKITFVLFRVRVNKKIK